jgi:DNA-binding NarL/FixJ family response regulator
MCPSRIVLDRFGGLDTNFVIRFEFCELLAIMSVEVHVIRVLLVIETELMGNVIANVLEDEPDIEVVGCVTGFVEALQFVDQTAVDVVLVSTRISDGGALELTRQLTERDTQIKVLALGLNEHKQRVLQYVEAGASGYIRDDHSVDELVEIVRDAHHDRARVPPRIAAALIDRVSELSDLLSRYQAGMSTELHVLTDREREVLEYIAQGYSNQKIAEILVIGVGTVKNHVHNILRKLEVKNREEAATYLAIFKGDQFED